MNKSVTESSRWLKLKTHASTGELVIKPPVIVVWQRPIVDGVKCRAVIVRPNASLSQYSLNLFLARSFRNEFVHDISALLERRIRRAPHLESGVSGKARLRCVSLRRVSLRCMPTSDYRQHEQRNRDGIGYDATPFAISLRETLRSPRLCVEEPCHVPSQCSHYPQGAAGAWSAPAAVDLLWALLRPRWFTAVPSPALRRRVGRPAW